MKRNVFLGTLLSSALALNVAAQTGSATDQQSSAKQNQEQVTVTGCLASADTATGTSGTAGSTGQASGTSKSEGQFMLTNARITSGAAAASGTAGTGGTGTAGTAASTSNNRFILIGGNQQELKNFLNSEVEIRGTLQPRTGADRSSAATGSSATGSAQRSAQSDPNANLQRIRVTSVKQTAKTCSGGN